MGVFRAALGLFLVVFGSSESTTYGWVHARKPFPLWQPGSMSIVPFAVAIGLVILVGFAFWELRVERGGGAPIVSMQLFRNRTFVSGASVVGVMMLAQNGWLVSLPVFLQSLKNLDAFHTVLTLLPMSLMLVIVSPSAAHLTKTINHKRLLQTGLLINAISILVLRQVLSADMKLVALIPGLALYGVGLGLVLSHINNLPLSSVPLKDAGEASGVTNTFRQIGASLGAAVIGAILLSSILTNLEGAVMRSQIPQPSKVAIDGMLRAQASGLAFGGDEIFGKMPPPVRQQMVGMRRAATTIGIRNAFLFGALFALLGLGVASWLPLRPKEQPH